MKVILGSQVRSRSMRRKLVCCTYEVQLKVFKVSAALETFATLALVCHKTIEARAQKRLKTGFARVVNGEVVLLKCIREEALCQVLGVFIVGLPLEPNVFVDRLPVAC